MQTYIKYLLSIMLPLCLNRLEAVNYDAAAVFPTPPSEYTQTPLSQVINLNLSANVENQGTMNITNVKLGIKVVKEGAVIATLTSSNTIATIVPNAANSFVISYLPADTGLYTFKYYPIFSQTDGNAVNDTTETNYYISVSEYSRHLGNEVGSYGIGTGDGDAMLGSLFTVN